MSIYLKTPVLFLIFNRPDTTSKVLDAIREAQPPRLYVAADGPRESREGEWQQCESARQIATQVDWNCDVFTLFREENLGCKKAVSEAIDWFFSEEEEGIILEDDCLPDKTFFPYCQELLEFYRDEPKVMSISGNNFHFGVKVGNASYHFSKYAQPWGWASWRRAWKNYDLEMNAWPEFRDQGRLKNIDSGMPGFVKYWRKIFQLTYSSKIDTWDYQWVFSCLKEGGLTCIPQVNLVSNIGFGVDPTHTFDPNSKLSEIPVLRISFPLVHPPEIALNRIAERRLEATRFGIGWKFVLIKFLHKFPAVFNLLKTAKSYFS